MIVIARDSVITAGTPPSRHSSCLAVLWGASLKTQLVGVNRGGSMKQNHSGAVPPDTCNIQYFEISSKSLFKC